jgi:hypothetical protein
MVEDDDRMAVGGDLLADLGQMQAHGLGVDGGQDERGGGSAARADRAEQVGSVGRNGRESPVTRWMLDGLLKRLVAAGAMA